MIGALHAEVDAWERDRSLFEPARLRQRIEALDRLEHYLAWPLRENSEGEAALHARMSRLCADLEAANRDLYRSLREEIRRGAGAKALSAWAPAPDSDAREDDGQRYDFLDALLSGVLRIDEPAADVAALEPDMVSYQPTPARHIFDMIDRAGLDERDVLIDLGSGLGHVPLLAAVCTGAHCVGIEREAAYVDCATLCAQALGLANARFVRQDAREADLSAGTVFYLYTPFTGAMLEEMLARLKREANAREIRIATLGPCTPVVARERWLRSADALKIDEPALFRSI